MATEKGKPVEPRCSFCGRGLDEVIRIFTGPHGEAICDECATLCSDTAAEETWWMEKIGSFFRDGPARIVVETGPEIDVVVRLEREETKSLEARAPLFSEAFLELWKLNNTAQIGQRPITTCASCNEEE